MSPPTPPGFFSAPFSERPCECVSRHVPKPVRVELHHVYPQADQIRRYGSVVDETTVPLCDTGHASVHEGLRRILRGEDYRLGNHYLQGIVDQGLQKIREGI